MDDDTLLSLDQLRVGLYIDLDLKWFEHPFPFSRFKIKNEEQIAVIRTLGLKAVRYHPSLSDVRAPSPAPVASAPEAPPAGPCDISPVLAEKRAMMARIAGQRAAAAQIEHAFVQTAKTIREIERNVMAQPAETVRQAHALVGQITDSILCAPDLAIHVMGDQLGGEELYFHALNVTMLSIMVARDLKLPVEVVRALGMGGLFHDIGRKRIPDKVLLKGDPWTVAERHLYEMHCEYGLEIGKKLQFGAPVLAIIGEHHECFDGTGYPRRLQGDTIGLLSRIVVIANYYDELCNASNGAEALTPHDALSLMFAKLRGKFDPKLLQVFIRCLGVYPPGTIVQLSNGALGMVVSINTAKPMKPIVLIYDAQVPKEEAILVDMEREPDTNIVKAIKPAHVPQQVYRYLSPRKQVSYYFDAGKSGPQGGRT